MKHIRKAKFFVIYFVVFAIFISYFNFNEKYAFASSQTGIVTASSLNVRTGPGTTYPVIATLASGDNITILSSEKDTSGNAWYNIAFTFGDITKNGYVSASYVTTQKSGSDAAFEAYLNSQGFPESYKPKLRQLHAAHPQWVFSAKQIGLNWSDVLSAESVVGRNLVPRSSTDSWKSFEKGAYNWQTNTWYGLDVSGTWIAASKEIIAYYLDPRNFLMDSSIFQFLSLSYSKGSETQTGVESILNGTFMSNKTYQYVDAGVTKTTTYGATFMDAAESSGVSSYNLATRVRQEQGVNGTPLSFGTVTGYEGYFNFFNIGAFDDGKLTALQNGALYAKNQTPPWTSPYTSILGGAKFIGSGYISKGQDTLYLQKFDVVDGGNGYYNHQYMTNIQAAASEASSMSNAYSGISNSTALVFNIPVYNSMPDTAAGKPASTGNCNDLLNSISISGATITPQFDKYVQAYSLNVDNSMATIALNAVPSCTTATVTGAGNISLQEGNNIVNIKVTAASGSERVYSLNIYRQIGPISAPASVQATAASYNSININWASVDGANGYEIWRATSSNGNYSKIAATAATSYIDNGLTAGTTYYYQIRAYKTIDGTTIYSGYSLAASAMPVLAVPASINAAAASYNSINVNWAAVSGAAGYELYSSTSSAGTYSQIVDTAATSYVDTNLATGTTYYYKVRAYALSGTTKVYSDYCTAVSCTPVLSAPASIRAATASYNSISTSWAAVNGATGYELYSATSGTGTYSLLADTAATSYTNTNLATGTTYYYKVRAYRLVGTTKVYGGYSAIASNTLILPKPASIKAAAAGYNSINTSWAAVSGASGYELYRATSSTGTYSMVASTTATSYTNTNLVTGTTYYYKVRAYRMVGTTKVYSDYSAIVSAKPVPSAVTNFKAVRYSSTSIKVSWSAVSGASGYEIYRATSSTGTYSFITSSTGLYFINTGLTTGRTYYYKMRAYRIVGTTKVYSDWTSAAYAKP